MYCRKCGNDMKDAKFCTKCGFSIEEPIVEETKPTTEPKKSSKKGVFGVFAIVGIIFAATIGFIALIFILTFKVISNVATKEFVEMNDLMVPSVYKATKEKNKVCGVSFSSKTDEGSYLINYCKGLSKSTIEEYVDYLLDEAGYSLYEGPYMYNLQKEEDGFVIYVMIVDKSNIKYSYVRGDLNNTRGSIGV